MASHNKSVVCCKREPKQETREPVEVQKGVEVLELADSAEETTYIHPASKSRFGYQHKGLRSGQQQQQLQQEHVSGMTMLADLSHPSHCEGSDIVNRQPHAQREHSVCMVCWILLPLDRASQSQTKQQVLQCELSAEALKSM